MGDLDSLKSGVLTIILEMIIPESVSRSRGYPDEDTLIE